MLQTTDSQPMEIFIEYGDELACGVLGTIRGLLFSNEGTSGETGSTLRLPKLFELDPGCRPDSTPVCNG